MSRVFRKAKKVHISAPNLIEGESGSLKANVSLVCKYDFEAENDAELNIKKGDLVKMLDKVGDGWILVKYLDKIERPGLIPSSYVDIAYNDVVNPITMSFLEEKPRESLSDQYTEMTQRKSFILTKAKTINNEAYPVSATIYNCLLFENRYWYRLDVTLSDGSKAYVCRYYQDFYDLHLAFLEKLNQFKDNDYNVSDWTLPKLPAPVPSARNKREDTTKLLALKRCNDLQLYINRLLLSGFQSSNIFTDWLSVGYKGLGGFAASKGFSPDSDDEINAKVCPNSIEDAKKEKVLTIPSVSEDEKQPDMPQRTRSKNCYNHYQQARRVNTTKPSRKALKINTSMINTSLENNSSLTSVSDTSISGQSIGTPETPCMESPFGKKSLNDYIKCKVISGNNDIIAIKLNKLEIHSSHDIKLFVSKKIHFNNLFIKVDDFVPIDSPNLDFAGYLKVNNKMLLKSI